MKNPLSYQSTEYDCGPTTMLNAINYLFHRENIAPDVVKSIMQYCLDCYNEQGEAYKSGTTGMAMLFLANWLNHFGKVRNWPINCEVLNGDTVFMGANSKMKECLQQGGAVIVRVMLGCWHYVLLTKANERYVYLFDPYYRKNPFKNKDIEMIYNQPKKMNRRITHTILNSETLEDYALGPKDTRECVLIYNKDTRLGMSDLQYII